MSDLPVILSRFMKAGLSRARRQVSSGRADYVGIHRSFPCRFAEFGSSGYGAAMTFAARIPRTPLSLFVSVLWHAEHWQPSQGGELHLPDGSVNLTILLDGELSRKAMSVTGPKAYATELRVQRPRSLIGAQFRHGGVVPFLSVPVGALAGTSMPAADVCGQDADVLRDQLLCAADADARLALFERWLAAKLRTGRLPDPAVTWAAGELERCPTAKVGEVASRIGISRRSFVDRFTRDVGLTPKIFGRVQRFQRALRMLHTQDTWDFAAIALAVGYFDQAHFTHEFRRITGATPTRYLESRTAFINHMRR
jgi:AraC-like DNA-binding protein